MPLFLITRGSSTVSMTPPPSLKRPQTEAIVGRSDRKCWFVSSGQKTGSNPRLTPFTPTILPKQPIPEALAQKLPPARHANPILPPPHQLPHPLRPLHQHPQPHRLPPARPATPRRPRRLQRQPARRARPKRVVSLPLARGPRPAALRLRLGARRERAHARAAHLACLRGDGAGEEGVEARGEGDEGGGRREVVGYRGDGGAGGVEVVEEAGFCGEVLVVRGRG